MTAEEERTRLIGDIARVLRDDGGDGLPDETRAAALTLIGWLARRMPGEPVSRCDIARCSGVTYSPQGAGPHEHDGPPSQKRRVPAPAGGSPAVEAKDVSEDDGRSRWATR
jgi:hypothetical protein